MNKRKLAKKFLQQLGDAYRIGAVSFPTGGCVPNDDTYDKNVQVLKRLMPHFNAQAQDSLRDKNIPLVGKRKGNERVTSNALHSLNVLARKTKMDFPEGAEDDVIIEFVERYNAALDFFQLSKSDRDGDAPRKVAVAVIRYGDNLLTAAQDVVALEDDEEQRELIKVSFVNQVLNRTTKVYDLVEHNHLKNAVQKNPHVLDALDYNA